MARVARIPEPRLMSEMNVTPFIDVMLVLLIVMILSIPIATQKVPIDLPSGPSKAQELLPPSVLAINQQGALSWNGEAIPDAALADRLGALQKSGATLHLQTDPEARYERFDAILARVKLAGITRLGFVGNRPLEN
jgi:biopolymer transport protein ExbD